MATGARVGCLRRWWKQGRVGGGGRQGGLGPRDGNRSGRLSAAPPGRCADGQRQWGAKATECSPLYSSVPLFNPAHKPSHLPTSPPAPAWAHCEHSFPWGDGPPFPDGEARCFQLGTSSQPRGERAPAGLPAALQRPCCRQGAGSGCGEPTGTHQVDTGPSQSGSLTRCSVLSLAEQTWPSTHETLLTTWKIVAFTATSVLLVLLLVILARMFQTKFKAHFPTR